MARRQNEGFRQIKATCNKWWQWWRSRESRGEKWGKQTSVGFVCAKLWALELMPTSVEASEGEIGVECRRRTKVQEDGI